MTALLMALLAICTGIQAVQAFGRAAQRRIHRRHCGHLVLHIHAPQPGRRRVKPP